MPAPMTATKPTEKRACPRRAPDRPLRAWLTAPALGGGGWAAVCDLAPGGAGIYVECPLAPGDRCLLWGCSAAPLPLTVAHARPWRAGYFLGCAFDRPLTDRELAALADGPGGG
jgi:hypothetical protein